MHRTRKFQTYRNRKNCQGRIARTVNLHLSLARELILLAAILTLVLCTVVQPALAARPPTLTGVAIGSLDESRAKVVRQAGITWIRNDVEFTSKFQNTYAVANKYGISIVGILDYSLLGNNAAFTLKDWTKLVGKAQKTYPLIHVWEIWNEPTLRIYQLGYQDGTPEHYVDLLKAAYTTVKAGDKNAVVLGLGGALLGFYKDFPFAQRVFSLGGGSYMDAFSVHAYPSDLNAGKSWDYYKQLWTEELAQYKQLGGKPFWVTETGLQSSQMTNADQVTFLQNDYAFFKEQGAVGFIWFQLVDYYQSDGTLITYGLVDIDLAPKPSYAVYATLAK